MKYGRYVAMDGGEIALRSMIDGGEVEMETNIDGGEIGAFMLIYPEPYTGDLVVTPKAWTEQVLHTAYKTMPGDVTVLEVPYFETHNPNGMTVYIANEV